MQSLLHELGLPSTPPPILWCDNLGAMYHTINPIYHARAKHVGIDFHFIREKVANRVLNVRFISSKDRLVDFFTKGLSPQRFNLLRDKLNVQHGPFSQKRRMETKSRALPNDTISTSQNHHSQSIGSMICILSVNSNSCINSLCIRVTHWQYRVH